MVDEALAKDVGRFSWYHTLELGEGVVTNGMFDHRPIVDRCLPQADLAGMRCLDVGTMDGFWAFEMERRGADEVVAADLADPEQLDWPPLWRPRTNAVLDETKQERFSLARAALGSQVERIERSAYELDRDLGEFDLIVCGDLLNHLKDPITALERIRHVCRGSAIVYNPISRFRLARLFRRWPLPEYRRRPLVEFDGIDGFQWWLFSEEAIERMMRAIGFARVEVGRRFELPAAGGWKGLRAVIRGYA